MKNLILIKFSYKNINVLDNEIRKIWLVKDQ